MGGVVASPGDRAAADHDTRQRHERRVEHRHEQNEHRNSHSAGALVRHGKQANGGEEESEKEAAAVAHEDRCRLEVVNEEPERRTHEGRDEHYEGCRSDVPQHAEIKEPGDGRDSCGESVDVVEQVECIRNAHDPGQRDRHVDDGHTGQVERRGPDDERDRYHQLNTQLQHRSELPHVVCQSERGHRQAAGNERSEAGGFAGREGHANGDPDYREAACQRDRGSMPPIVARMGDETGADRQHAQDRRHGRREGESDQREKKGRHSNPSLTIAVFKRRLTLGQITCRGSRTAATHRCDRPIALPHAKEIALECRVSARESLVERAAQLTIRGADDENLLRAGHRRARDIALDISQLHAFFEDAVLAHDIDGDLRVLVRGARFGQNDAAAVLQDAPVGRHCPVAVRDVVKALVRKDRIDGGLPDRQMLDVADDEMRTVGTHALDANLEIAAADIHADRLDARLEQPLSRPCVAAAAVNQRISSLQIEERNRGTEEFNEIDREPRVVPIERRHVAGREELIVVHPLANRYFGAFVVCTRVFGDRAARLCAARRVFQRGEEIAWKHARAAVEECSIPAGVAEVIRQQFGQESRDRKPSTAGFAGQYAFPYFYRPVAVGCR